MQPYEQHRSMYSCTPRFRVGITRRFCTAAGQGEAKEKDMVMVINIKSKSTRSRRTSDMAFTIRTALTFEDAACPNCRSKAKTSQTSVEAPLAVTESRESKLESLDGPKTSRTPAA